ncbi:MAG: fructose-bisphosphate aldolase class I [Candidatus Woesearchaeota archaeon]|jgi:fructose-bisphosphate aldolase class I|nr:fructose-bisphosphate aldolase class I [Candidatus Woesearchaeota archaeon]
MVNKKLLENTVREMVGPGKVIMAMDESTGTMNGRLQKVGMDPTVESAEAWRELIVTAPDLTGVGAAILYEGTVDQKVDGTPVHEILAERGIVPGVKLDQGKVPVIKPYDENNTIGLDTLHEKLEEHGGAIRFAKWRSEFVIGPYTPTRQAIDANTIGLKQFVIACQEHDVVPIFEPEVLIKGDHDIYRAFRVNQRVLSAVFEALDEAGAYLPGAILKASFVTPGSTHRRLVDHGTYTEGYAEPEEVAKATIDCWTYGGIVPTDLGAGVFLSGGLSDIDAVRNLDAVNKLGNEVGAPWILSASFGRAEIGEALEHWRGDPAYVAEAQAILNERTAACGLARDGKLPDGFRYERTARQVGR